MDEEACMKILLEISRAHETEVRILKLHHEEDVCKSGYSGVKPGASAVSSLLVEPQFPTDLPTDGLLQSNLRCSIIEESSIQDNQNSERLLFEPCVGFSCYEKLRASHFIMNLTTDSADSQPKDQLASREDFNLILQTTINLLLFSPPTPVRKDDIREAWILSDTKGGRRHLSGEIIDAASRIIGLVFGLTVGQTTIGTADLLYLRQGLLFRPHIDRICGQREMTLRGFLIFLKMNFTVYGSPLPTTIIASNMQSLGWRDAASSIKTDLNSAVSTISRKYPISLNSAAGLLAECFRLRYININNISKNGEVNEQVFDGKVTVTPLLRLQEEFCLEQFASDCKNYWNCTPPGFVGK